ncbi:MAG TPA: calcium-binding protein [Rhizobiaceae bacterium]|nr:calcium-binding protein [Rhizobiaceae bacterium]
MATIVFTGDDTRTDGTSFAVLAGFDRFLGLIDQDSLPDGRMFLEGFGFLNGPFGNGARYVEISGDGNALGQMVITSITARSSVPSGGGFADILALSGIHSISPVTLQNVDTPAGLGAGLQFINRLLAGSDTFDISGDFEEGWGDFRTVPGGAPIQLGHDIFQFGALTTNGASKIVIYGDARTAGANARGGHDIIDVAFSGTTLGVDVYGDFRTAKSNSGWGCDVIRTSHGSDLIYGDGPNSTTTGGNDILSSGVGPDSLFGGGGNDYLNGGSGGDVLNGGYGDDRLEGSFEADEIVGGPGFDYAVFGSNGSLTDTVVDLLFPNQNTGEAAGDMLSGIEGLIGAVGASDTLRGNNLANTILGRSGDDALFGRGGNDTLIGGAGADSLNGGVGNDVFVLENGADTVTDVSGIDRITSTITRNLVSYATIENLTLLGAGAINGVGNGRANTITGNNNKNALSGVNGNDVLNGLGGSDTLSGGFGLDRLTGGLGIDRLTGGTQADRFIFNSVTESRSAGGRDTIVDFSHTQGDRIQLSGIDANTKLAGNQAFTFIGTAAFGGVAGQLRAVKIGTDSHIYADVNGDRAIDMHIISNVAVNFTEADFVL